MCVEDTFNVNLSERPFRRFSSENTPLLPPILFHPQNRVGVNIDINGGTLKERERVGTSYLVRQSVGHGFCSTPHPPLTQLLKFG